MGRGLMEKKKKRKKEPEKKPKKTRGYPKPKLLGKDTGYSLSS